jgi:hypothetical protein
VAVGGWLGTRSRRLHFCGDRGFRATVSGTTRGYPGHPARWLIGRDVASVAWLRGALGVRRPPQSAAYAPRARRGEGTRNESDPALFGLYRGRCRPAGSAGSGMASATGLERWLVSAPAPSPVSAGALCLASTPAPCVASGPASSPVPAAALCVVSGPAPCWVSAPAPRVVSTPAECLVPARVVSAPAASLVPAPAPCL